MDHVVPDFDAKVVLCDDTRIFDPIKQDSIDIRVIVECRALMVSWIEEMGCPTSSVNEANMFTSLPPLVESGYGNYFHNVSGESK